MPYYKSRKSMFRSTNGLYYSNNNQEVESDNEEAEQYETLLSFNLPAFIRLLEIVREDIKTDDDLHILVEKTMDAAADGDAIDMDDIIEITAPPPQKRSLPIRRTRDGRRI